MNARRVPYAGIATRAVGLALDVLFADLLVLVTAGVLALVGSLVGLELSNGLKVAAAGGWVLIVAAYFVFFWAATGQTPGMRLMRLRVAGADGRPPRVGRSILRVIGLGLSIIPLFAGFLPVLVDDRRRGLLDFLADTVVVYADEPFPELERAGVAVVGEPLVPPI
ncbi:MAG: RDD family protein [Thermoleophilaceae bacterium]